MDDTAIEDKKKQFNFGDFLAAFGAVGYFLYQNSTPKARRLQLRSSWQRAYLKELAKSNPSFARLPRAQREALERYTQMMLTRSGDELLQQKMSSEQLADLHRSIVHYVPGIADKISPAVLYATLDQAKFGVYAAESEQINARLGADTLKKIHTDELKEEARTRMRETIQRSDPALSYDERERVFRHLEEALKAKDAADVPQQLPRQLDELVRAQYKTTPTPREEAALTALAKAWRTDTHLSGLPPAVAPAVEHLTIQSKRTQVFNAVNQDMERELSTRIAALPNGKTMLASAPLQDEIKHFAYLSTASQRDELFVAPNPTHEWRALKGAEALLKQFPQLKNLLTGALIYETQNTLAARYNRQYDQSVKELEEKPQELHALRAQEDSELLTHQYERELENSNLSAQDKAQRKTAFLRAAQEELAADRTGKTLMQRVEKRLRTAGGSAYRDEGFAFNKTFAWYVSQPELQRRISASVTPATAGELRRDKSSYTPLPREVLRAIERPHFIPEPPVITPMRSINWASSAADRVFGNALDLGARAVNRVFSPGNLARSALQQGAGRVAQQVALGAVRTPASWPFILGGIAIVVIIIMFMMLMDTNTMLAAAPYAKQDIVQTNNGVAPSPTLIEVPHAVTAIGPPTGPVPTLSSSFPSLMTQGYGKPGQTWEELDPSYDEPTDLPVQGYVTWYGAFGLMAEVATNRAAWGQITPCDECIGDISLLRFGDINRRVWIRRANGNVEGPYRVVDCAATHDVATILNKSIGGYRWVADLSREIARDWNFTSEVVVIMDSP